MKKIVYIVVILIFVISIFIGYMLINDKKYVSKMKKSILDNTELTNLEYVNLYNGYYTLLSGDYLYVLDNKYKEMFKIDRILLYDNNKNYDIIYNDDVVMYFDDYYKDGKLIYNYYDIYTYKLINSIEVG